MLMTGMVNVRMYVCVGGGMIWMVLIYDAWISSWWFVVNLVMDPLMTNAWIVRSSMNMSFIYDKRKLLLRILEVWNDGDKPIKKEIGDDSLLSPNVAFS